MPGRRWLLPLPDKGMLSSAPAETVALEREVSQAESWKIAIDLRSVLPEHSGIGVYAQELARAMIRMAPSHRYLFFGVRGAPAVAESSPPCVQYLWTARTPQNRYLRHIWENVSLRKHLARWQADLFHSTASFLPLRDLPQATVVTIHDLTCFKLLDVHTRSRGALFRFGVRRSVALADAVIAVSESTRRDIVEIFKIDEDRVSVVYHGVHARFSPVPDPASAQRLLDQQIRPPFILAVGTIEPRKNHVRLIHAFERVAPNFPSLELVLAGRRGWMNRDVFRTIDRSPVRGRIRHLGYVANEELSELYRQASVMAYPSLYEGFGMPLLEALASGTPVLASDRSSVPEVVGQSALLVDPTSVAQIAQGLNTLLTNSALRTRFRQAGIERAQRFTWEAAADATLMVYQKALCRREKQNRSADRAH